MRKCLRCHTEMIENFDIKVKGALYGLKIAIAPGLLSKRIDGPKVAICPACGEISLYTEELSIIRNYSYE